MARRSDFRMGRKSRFLMMTGLLLIAILGGFWWWLRPVLLYRTAVVQFDRSPARAIETLEEALSLSNGTYPEARLLMSRALLKSGQRRAAMACFSLIKDTSRLDADMLIQLADDAAANDSVLLSSQALQAVSEGDSRFVDAANRKVSLLYSHAQWAAVLDYCEVPAVKSVLQPEALFMLADSLKHRQQLPQAVEQYESILEGIGEDTAQEVRAISALLELLLDLGDTVQAHHWFARLNSISSGQALTDPNRILQARLCRLEGRNQDARDCLNQLSDEAQALPRAVELLALLDFDRGNWSESEHGFRVLLQQEPWNKLAHYKLAQILLALNREDEAKRHFLRNEEINRLSLEILELQSDAALQMDELTRLTRLANAYEHLGQPQVARQLRAQVLTLP